MLDGELTQEYQDKNDSENFGDSDDAYILLKWGDHNKMPLGENNFKVQYDTPTIKHKRVQ